MKVGIELETATQHMPAEEVPEPQLEVPELFGVETAIPAGLTGNELCIFGPYKGTVIEALVQCPHLRELPPTAREILIRQAIARAEAETLLSEESNEEGETKEAGSHTEAEEPAEESSETEINEKAEQPKPNGEGQAEPSIDKTEEISTAPMTESTGPLPETSTTSSIVEPLPELLPEIDEKIDQLSTQTAAENSAPVSTIQSSKKLSVPSTKAPAGAIAETDPKPHKAKGTPAVSSKAIKTPKNGLSAAQVQEEVRLEMASQPAQEEVGSQPPKTQDKLKNSTYGSSLESAAESSTEPSQLISGYEEDIAGKRDEPVAVTEEPYARPELPIEALPVEEVQVAEIEIPFQAVGQEDISVPPELFRTEEVIIQELTAVVELHEEISSRIDELRPAEALEVHGLLAEIGEMAEELNQISIEADSTEIEDLEKELREQVAYLLDKLNITSDETTQRFVNRFFRQRLVEAGSIQTKDELADIGTREFKKADKTGFLNRIIQAVRQKLESHHILLGRLALQSSA